MVIITLMLVVLLTVEFSYRTAVLVHWQFIRGGGGTIPQTNIAKPLSADLVIKSPRLVRRSSTHLSSLYRLLQSVLTTFNLLTNASIGVHVKFCKGVL